MDIQVVLSIAIFLVVMTFIITERMNITVVAMGGAVLVVFLKIMTSTQALGFVDFNTIGILVGMMIIVSIVKNSGVFEYLAIYAAKLAKGDPWKIILILCIITAVISAFLDNVTTVLLIAPVTLVITDVLELDPIPFLIPIIMSSNIGGTATLIGDPPNIMIGSEAGLGFMDFIVNLAPIIIIIFIATFAIIKFLYRNKLKVSEDKKLKILAFDEKKAIRNLPLLKKSLFVLALVIMGFFLHELFGYPSAFVALFGAVLLMMISGESIDEVFQSVEWSTIFFFAGLFVVVGSLEQVGVINAIANGLISITGGNLLITGILIIWLSAIISAFLNNVPFIATLIPLIQTMGVKANMDVTPLWWAISLGACLGGNGTLIGASANVIVAGVAEKAGYKLTFKRYFKMGFPLMLVSIVISTIYIVVFYLI